MASVGVMFYELLVRFPVRGVACKHHDGKDEVRPVQMRYCLMYCLSSCSGCSSSGVTGSWSSAADMWRGV